MKIIDVPIDKIHVGARYREDLGDLESLAANIRDVGLLQPIGLDEYYKLVYGFRRLVACQSILQWKEIPCAILNIQSLLAGEYAENFFRKDFTTTEQVAIANAVQRELANRHGGDRRSSGAQAPLDLGRTHDLAAKRVGLGSRETLERAKQVIDFGSPELISAMDSKKISIKAAAAIANQPTEEQNRILEMPKDEQREVIRHIKKKRIDQ